MQIDRTTRQIDALDVDTAAAELAAYREIGRREWLQTEAPLSDVRAVLGLPGMLMRGLRRIGPEAKDLLGDIRNIGSATPVHRPISPEELETRRRTAIMLRYQLERNPKQHKKVRESALQAGPMIVQSTLGGSNPGRVRGLGDVPGTVGAITPDEARRFRHEAGRP